MYTAKVLEKLDNGKGYWNYLKIGIFDNENRQVGEYVRNYSSFYNTFFPFEQNGKWYALYSKDYTSTRIMSLPDCKDLGGEEGCAFGFCPVDYYVPMICVQDLKDEDPVPYNPRRDPDKWAKKIDKGSYIQYEWSETEEFKELCKKGDEEFRKWQDRNPFVERHAKFGFVAGCVWGDDSSWKIQHLDLSNPENGVKRDDRFGYIELPRGVKLKDAIDADFIDNEKDPPQDQRIAIACTVYFDLTGKKID